MVLKEARRLKVPSDVAYLPYLESGFSKWGQI